MKFTEQLFASALMQAELGTPVEEVCRLISISKGTLYNWKKYGGLGPSELRRLEQESTKLKQVVADLSRDKVMQQDDLSKSSEAFPQAHSDSCRSTTPKSKSKSDDGIAMRRITNLHCDG